MVRYQRVDGSVGQRQTDCIAITLLAQRWLQVRTAVKVTNIQVDQVQRVDTHVAGQRQALGLGLADQLQTVSAAQPAQVYPRARRPDQFNDGVDGDGFGRHRDSGQAHARCERTAGDHAGAEVAVLRAQPDGIAEGARVLHRAQQHLGVSQRLFSLPEADASGPGERHHFGQHLTGQSARQRAQRVDACLAQFLRAELQHLDQARFVEHRVGVGRAHQAGHATGNRCRHFGLQHARVLVAGFAQPYRQVDQPRRDDAARRINDAVGMKIGADILDRDDLCVGQRQIAALVKTARRVHHPPAPDEYLHSTSFPATIPITAIRTAMPKVTCGRITLWAPSTTAESISTPRLIGPGCITMASGLASCSFSRVSP